MNTQTWHVAITVADNGFDVTAKARLDDAAVDVVGLGVVPGTFGETTGESARALAAIRSLESLAEALGYVVETDRYADVDQA